MSPAFSCFFSEKCNFRSSSHSRCVADLFIKEIIESPVFFTQTGSMPCVANLHDYAASGAKEANPPLASSHAEAMDMRAEVSPLAVCTMLQKHAPDRRILRELPASSAPEKISGRCLRPLPFEYHQRQKIRQVAGQRQSLRCVRGPHLQRRFPQRGS